MYKNDLIEIINKELEYIGFIRKNEFFYRIINDIIQIISIDLPKYSNNFDVNIDIYPLCYNINYNKLVSERGELNLTDVIPVDNSWFLYMLTNNEYQKGFIKKLFYQIKKQLVTIKPILDDELLNMYNFNDVVLFINHIRCFLIPILTNVINCNKYHEFIHEFESNNYNDGYYYKNFKRKLYACLKIKNFYGALSLISALEGEIYLQNSFQSTQIEINDDIDLYLNIKNDILSKSLKFIDKIVANNEKCSLEFISSW